MTAPLVAAIRRLPGGRYVKVPKSQAMPAVPVHTTVSNLTTYFTAWPKRKSQFLLYGPRCFYHTATPGLDRNVPQKVPPGSPASFEGIDGQEFGLYGGAGNVGAATGGAADSPAGSAAAGAAAGGGGGAAAAAAASAAALARPLGLAGVMKRFRKGEKLTMVTAYDFPSARFARGAGAELVLVGDSLGNCRLGLPDTVGVTMEDMLSATKAARRGIDAPPHPQSNPSPGPKPVLIGDMPFGSYLIEAEGLRNAAAFRMAGADIVKLEGGRKAAPLVASLTNAGIAVMGHIGLEPQKALLQGGLRLQGTTAKSALEIVRDAQEIAAAGAVLLVVECVPAEVGRAVQAAVPNIPVIGIGAGGEVAGQVLVCDDLLGIHGSPPSFVKLFADLGKASANAYTAYRSEVRSGAFPGAQHSRRMKPEELSALRELLPELSLPEPAPTCAAPKPKEEARPSIGSSRSDVLAGWPPATPMVRPRAAVGAGMLQLANGRFTPLARAPVNAPGNSLRALSQLAAAGGDLRIISTRKEVNAWRKSSRRVALVPTMGNLHEGHLELVDEARRHADDVVVSIFVNPAQFAPHEDLDRYPRTFERDVELLRGRGATAVFAPKPAEVYPHGSPGGTVVVPRFVEGKSEDACRPHFFTGVATVCLKLFNACRPDVVVFGQKDAMQCSVISRMLEDLMLDLDISLVVAPTSREADGLARSSRNSYLTPGMRRAAPAIYSALSQATGTPGATPGSVRATVRAALEQVQMEVSYISVADPREMGEKADGDNLANSVVSVACLLRDGSKECRLIDNVVVPATGSGP